MLKIKNLKVQSGGEIILNGLNLNIKSGEMHVLMGPNGAGKSTLAKVLAGDEQYEVLEGAVLYEVYFKDQDLLSMEVSERAKEGMFMAFQYPIEIPGLNNLEFLKTAFNSICRHQGIDTMKDKEFQKFAIQKARDLKVDENFLNRDLNAGFSGGEKKQNEILQMMILSPRFSILDESDSGLDVDSIQKIARGIKKFINKDKSILLITHYHKLLKLIRPDFVHVIIEGQIRKTGGFSLAEKIEAQGYDWISKTTH